MKQTALLLGLVALALAGAGCSNEPSVQVPSAQVETVFPTKAVNDGKTVAVTSTEPDVIVEESTSEFTFYPMAKLQAQNKENVDDITLSLVAYKELGQTLSCEGLLDGLGIVSLVSKNKPVCIVERDGDRYLVVAAGIQYSYEGAPRFGATEIILDSKGASIRNVEVNRLNSMEATVLGAYKERLGRVDFAGPGYGEVFEAIETDYRNLSVKSKTEILKELAPVMKELRVR
ncbi:MAG: hypothetical protein KC585_03020 [Candidatus Magasanikbacteria bacterium]|nr:hypothetical protein [Candidatus Magasanikbacteria bacterium]